MRDRGSRYLASLMGALLLVALPVSAAPNGVEGSFRMNGVEAALTHARAKQVELEKGKMGYVVLLSERTAEGNIEDWRSGDPAKLGSFLFLMLESDGATWVAEIGHSASKSGRFGVVSELKTSGFGLAGKRLSGRLRTAGEETFSENRYTVDVSFEVPLEQ